MKKISNFEKKKIVLTELYNEVIRKQNENKIRANDIDDMMKELDKRKYEIENIKSSLTEKLDEIKKEKLKVDKEKKFVEKEKNNLLLRLESIDQVGIKYIGGQNMDEKEKNWKTQKEKFFYQTFAGNLVNPLVKSNDDHKNGNNFSNNKNAFSATDYFN